MAARTSLRWAMLCALVAVLVHWRALENGFALDDVRLVENNPAVASLARVPSIFLEPYWNVAGENYGLYRPLTIVSFAVNRAVLGAGPFGFHLVNVLLHASVSALAWFGLRRAGTQFGTALLGGLLFAVLPVHTEAVANVAGRAELLAALFVLGAWVAHRRANDEGASVDDTVRGPKATPRRGLLLLGYASACTVMLGLRALALGVHQSAATTIPLDNPAAAAGWGPRVLTAAWVQLKYALLCVAPTDLASDYSFDAIPVARSLGDPRVLGGVAFVAALVAAVAWGWHRSRPVVLAAAFWIVFFLPSANLLFPTGTIMAERLAYLPSLGVCLAIGHFGATLAARREPTPRGRWRPAVVAVLAAVAASAFAARSIVRIPDWKSNLTLALADVATMPRSAKLQAGAGMFLAETGRSAEAEQHLRRAVEIYPEYAQMHYNLAVLLARRGARDEAEEHLRRAIELAPGNPLPRRLLDRLTR
jgi:tetratricopeptide (TPR) repeat protein